MTDQSNSFTNILYTYDYINYNNYFDKNHDSILFNKLNQIDNIILIINSEYCKNQIKVLNYLILYFNKLKLNYTILKNSKDIESTNITNKSLIYFLPTLEQLNLNNFKEITLQYIAINQYLLDNNLSIKYIIFSTLSKKECTNYLNASVLGSMRYFLEFNKLDLYFVDFDLNSINNKSIKTINSIILNNENNNRSHREFIIRNDSIFIEIIQNSPNLLNNKNKNQEFYNNNILDKDESNKTILITGQTGTAFNIVNWLINNKSNQINNIIILTASNIKKDLNDLINNHYGIENLKKVQFFFIKCDISSFNNLELSINQLYDNNRNLPKPDTIIHFAFVKASYTFKEINLENLEKSLSVKAMGSIYLHLLSIKFGWPIKSFINGSSTCSLLGLKDECGYVSASCLLDSLMRFRNSIGSFGTSVNWGSISRDALISKVFDDQGLLPVPNDIIFSIVDSLIFNQNNNNINNNNRDNDLNNSNFVVSLFNLNHFKKLIENTNYYYLFNNIFSSYGE